MAEYRRSCATYVTYRATAYYRYKSPSPIPVVALAVTRRQSRIAGLYSGTFGHASPYVPCVHRQKRRVSRPKQSSRRFSSYRPRFTTAGVTLQWLSTPPLVSPWRTPWRRDPCRCHAGEKQGRCRHRQGGRKVSGERLALDARVDPLSRRCSGRNAGQQGSRPAHLWRESAKLGDSLMHFVSNLRATGAGAGIGRTLRRNHGFRGRNFPCGL